MALSLENYGQSSHDYADVLFHRERRELSPRNVSLEHIKFTDWYPVDRWKVEKYIQDAFQKDTDGTLWGIKHPCHLFRLQDENQYRIGDGYHRIAAQVVMIGRMYGLVPAEFPPYYDLEEHLPQLLPSIIEKVKADPRDGASKILFIPAVVKEDATFQDLWNERTSSLIGQHEHVRFARLIQLVSQQWPKKWLGFSDALSQAIKRDKDSSGKSENNPAVNFILDITDKWHMKPLTLYTYWELSERLHPALIPKVRIVAQKGELSLVQAKAFAASFPGKDRDWQLTMYKLLQTENISSDVESLQSTCSLVKNLIPYYRSASSLQPEDMIRLVSKAYTLWNREKAIVMVTKLRESFSQLSFAPWWETNPEVRAIAFAIFQRAVDENITPDQMDALLEETIPVFFKKPSVSVNGQVMYIEETDLPAACDAANRKIASFSPDHVRRGGGPSSGIIYTHPDRMGQEIEPGEELTQIIDHLIDITIRLSDMHSVNQTPRSALSAHKYESLQKLIAQLKIYARQKHVSPDKMLQLVECIDRYISQVPISKNHHP